ncbi:hypothetical protein ACHAXT_003459 [Thalassiosira profunda]
MSTINKSIHVVDTSHPSKSNVDARRFCGTKMRQPLLHKNRLVDSISTGIATRYPADANPCGRYKMAGPTIPLTMPSAAEGSEPPSPAACGSSVTAASPPSMDNGR